MADLREVFARLGYTEVRTLLNSGNVVFTAADGGTKARIEAAISKKFGFAARVIVFDAADFAEVVAGNPLAGVATDPSRLLVAFLDNPDDRALLEPLTRQNWEPEMLGIGARAAYLWCANGLLAGRLWEAVNRALGDAVTARNWGTVMKIQAAMNGGGARPGPSPGRASRQTT